MAYKMKNIRYDKKDYMFTPGKGGSLMSPSKRMGEMGFQMGMKKMSKSAPMMKTKEMDEMMYGIQAPSKKGFIKKKRAGIVRALSYPNY